MYHTRIYSSSTYYCQYCQVSFIFFNFCFFFFLFFWQVVYATRAQADIAFNGIPTDAQEDTSGRLQKKIYTSTDGKKYITVSQQASNVNNYNDVILFSG